jgi:hypothetical protein
MGRGTKQGVRTADNELSVAIDVVSALERHGYDVAVHDNSLALRVFVDRPRTRGRRHAEHLEPAALATPGAGFRFSTQNVLNLQSSIVLRWAAESLAYGRKRPLHQLERGALSREVGSDSRALAPSRNRSPVRSRRA